MTESAGPELGDELGVALRTLPALDTDEDALLAGVRVRVRRTRRRRRALTTGAVSAVVVTAALGYGQLAQQARTAPVLPAGSTTAGPLRPSSTTSTPTPTATFTDPTGNTTPRPELVLPGEPVPFMDDMAYQAWATPDEKGTESVPRAIPDPAAGPHHDLVPINFWSASPRNQHGVETVGAEGGIAPVGSRMVTYWEPALFAASPTAPNRVVNLNISTWRPGQDAIALLETDKTTMHLQPRPGEVAVPYKAAGASRSWMHRLDAGAQGCIVSAMAQRGTTLVSVSSPAPTCETSEAMTRWFVQAALTKLPS